jgi:hypothetical protein
MADTKSLVKSWRTERPLKRFHYTAPAIQVQPIAAGVGFTQRPSNVQLNAVAEPEQFRGEDRIWSFAPAESQVSNYLNANLPFFLLVPFTGCIFYVGNHGPANPWSCCTVFL